MTDDELSRVIEALDAVRSVSFYGADGEWGYRALDAGRYVYFSHVPYEPGVEEVVQGDDVRRALASYDYAHVTSRLR